MVPVVTLDKAACALALEHPDTPGIVLHVIALAALGPALYEDEDGELPDSVNIWLQLQDAYDAQISEEGENRLNATLMATASDAFFTSPEGFMAICGALAHGDIGDAIEGNLDTDLTSGEMALAVWEVDFQRDEPGEFSEPVKALINKILSGEGDEAPEDDTAYTPAMDFTLLAHKNDVLNGLVAIKAPPSMITHMQSEISKEQAHESSTQAE